MTRNVSGKLQKEVDINGRKEDLIEIGWIDEPVINENARAVEICFFPDVEINNR